MERGLLQNIWQNTVLTQPSDQRLVDLNLPTNSLQQIAK